MKNLLAFVLLCISCNSFADVNILGPTITYPVYGSTQIGTTYPAVPGSPIRVRLVTVNFLGESVINDTVGDSTPQVTAKVAVTFDYLAYTCKKLSARSATICNKDINGAKTTSWKQSAKLSVTTIKPFVLPQDFQGNIQIAFPEGIVALVPPNVNVFDYNGIQLVPDTLRQVGLNAGTYTFSKAFSVDLGISTGFNVNFINPPL